MNSPGTTHTRVSTAISHSLIKKSHKRRHHIWSQLLKILTNRNMIKIGSLQPQAHTRTHCSFPPPPFPTPLFLLKLSKSNKGVAECIRALTIPSYWLFRINLKVARITWALDLGLVRRQCRLRVILLPIHTFISRREERVEWMKNRKEKFDPFKFPNNQLWMADLPSKVRMAFDIVCACMHVTQTTCQIHL